MAAILGRALEQVKREWKTLLSGDRILAACQAVGHNWRDRKFGPVETVHLFLLQVLNGNTAITHLSHLWGAFVNASAFCEARQRLPLAVWEWLLENIGAELRLSTQTLWHGLRVWLVDGSSFSMADTIELARYFGYPGNQRPGCGFPVAHLLVLMDMASGLCRRAHPLPLNQNDLPHMPAVHAVLRAGDLLVGDRGFCSYAHLAVLQQHKIHGVFRVHASQRVSFIPGRPCTSWRTRRRRRRKTASSRKNPRKRTRHHLPTSKWVRSLGPDDQLVLWQKPLERPDWLTPEEYAALPDELLVREVRYQVLGKGSRVRTVTLVTTLLDAQKFPASELQKLYGWRWEIETNFKHLKTTMGLDVLKCRTIDGVRKELTAFVLIYNLVRTIMHAAAQYHNLPVNRISFVDAQRWLASNGQMPLHRIIVNPHRPERYEPRVRKRRPKPYPLMTRPRRQLRKQLTRNTL